MHRTDIEGFGHYEDRREMELKAGSIGGPALATTGYGAPASTYTTNAPAYTTTVGAGQYVSGTIPATTTSNVVSIKSLNFKLDDCPTHNLSNLFSCSANRISYLCPNYGTRTNSAIKFMPL